MADLINLRRFKKTKARQEKVKIGAQNRVKFSRTATEKKQSKAAQERSAKFLDGVRRETKTNTTRAAHKLGDK